MHFNKILKKDKFTLILFHGVISNKKTRIRNYTKKHIEKKKFEKILKYLTAKGNPISLDQYINYQKKNIKLPKYSFSLSFDDGFENNFSVAFPILKKYKIPTIFYVSTNLVQKNLMTWIDQIEYLLEKKNFVIEDFMGTKKFNLSNKKNKINFLTFLRKKIKSNPSKYDVKKLVSEIYAAANEKIIESSSHELDKKMSLSQIKKISNNKLFTVGAHCHNHVSMAFLNKRELKYEITTSIKVLENNIKRKIYHFSYPEGMWNDFNQKVIDELKKNKIVCCPTAIFGHNKINENLFFLKRIMIT
tara:strand:+ start:2478 stop:3383 length:906 start_codon:yes stop_codon:yes gene_type:complete